MATRSLRAIERQHFDGHLTARFVLMTSLLTAYDGPFDDITREGLTISRGFKGGFRRSLKGTTAMPASSRRSAIHRYR